MANQIILVGDTNSLARGMISVTGTADIAETFQVNRDAVIRSIYYEIPAGCTLVIKLIPETNGPSVTLLNTTAGSSGEDGAVAAGRPLRNSTLGGVIQVTTTGNANGDKKVWILVSPIEAGV